MTEEMSPYVSLSLLLDKVSFVHRLLPVLNCDYVAGGMAVPVPGHLEEGVDGEVVHLVYDFKSLDKIPPHSSIFQ